METKYCSYCGKNKLLSEFNGCCGYCVLCQRKYDKQYYQKNKERKKEYRKKYVKNNRDKINKAEREKKKNNINFKLGQNLRSRLRRAINRNQKAGSTVKDLGCSIEELKIHLEKQFYPNPKTNEPMSWENYGVYGWHIDHIIPLFSFDLTDREQFLEACHYTNLQPLWAKDNLAKNRKIKGEKDE